MIYPKLKINQIALKLSVGLNEGRNIDRSFVDK